MSATAYRVVRGKAVRLPFALNGAAKVTITVLRGTRVVARLVTTKRAAVARGLLTWSGKIKGKPAPNGLCKVQLRAVSPAGASADDAATLRIT